MMSYILENWIKETYQNADYLLVLIRKFDLFSLLNSTMEQIDIALENKDKIKLTSVFGIVFSSLINKLEPLSEPKEKTSIEYLVTDIFNSYFKRISSLSGGKEILQKINNNLIDTCNILGCKYELLNRLFDVNKFMVLPPQKKEEGQLYYNWNGKIYELDGIIHDICNRRWIYSVKEFKKLFKPNIGTFQIRCNKEKRKELLLLFQVLKEKGLIQPKGRGNSGHFKPFVCFAVDNQSNNLFDKEINKYHELMKRKKAGYLMLKEKVEAVINKNAGNSIGQLVDNGHCPLVK